MNKKKESPPVSSRIAEHIYVPKHEILSSEEAEEILKRYNARPEQLPYILTTDPMIRLIGAKAGDIVRITRKSETAGETVYHRFVVEG